MAQLKKVVEPFGEVNVYPKSGKMRVVATILMETRKEGCQTGIALDGSGSMEALYAVKQEGGGFFSTIWSGTKKKTGPTNEITPVAQKLCAYLARKIDADGGTTCIYWATGHAGGHIEEIGDLTADEAEKHFFGPPKTYGSGTRLLPAVKYFTDRFKTAQFGFYVFITDGELHDLEEVKSHCRQLAKDVNAKKVNPVKFILIGVGPNVNERQMEELDDLQTGTPVDLWDHKIAAEMRQLEEIFAEVVDRNAIIAEKARILDPNGNVVKDFSDTGMSAYLQFEIDAGATYFTLEVNGNKIHQGLSDSVTVPPSEKTG